jgi:hypothetical protein
VGKEVAVLQNLARWIVSIFRPNDKLVENSGAAAESPAAAKPRLWLRWPSKLQIFGTRRGGVTTTATELAMVQQPDWDGILDSLFWSGYTGTGNPEEMLQRLRKMQDTAVDATRVEYFVRETGLRARLDSIAEERRQDRIDEPDVRARIDGLHAEREQVTASAHRARERLLSAYARLTALRHGFPVRQIQERLRAEAALSQTLSENVVATEQVRASAEDALLSREVARREKAGPAMAEWEAGHKERVRILREHSERQGNVVGGLRASGMTERMAGFFVWAGYVGMIIFGWRLGEVLHERAFPNAGSLHGLIAPLAQTAYRTFLTVGTRTSLWAIGVFLAVWLVGSFLIFFVFDKGLPLFDRRWNTDADEGGKESARETGVSYGGIIGILKARVSRSDYAHFLARTPLMAVPAMLGLLALLFFARAGQTLNTNPEFVNPINSFLFGLFGFAMAAGFTGCVALLLQPLLARRAGAAMAPVRMGMAVPAVGFAVLLLLTLLFAGVIPTADVWGPGSLVGPVLMITINAVTLSHGLVYRHVFRDWRALRKETTRLENEHWRKSPYSLLTPRDLKPQTLFDRWNRMHEEVREAWKAQDASVAQVLDDLPQIYSRTSTDARTSAAAAGAKADPEAGKRTGWSPQFDDLLRGTRVTMLDGRLEPELTAEVVAARTAYHDAREVLEEVGERLAEARERLHEIESARLDEKFARLEGDVQRLTAERAVSEAEVEARYAALCQEGASAYEGGRQLAERLTRVTSGTIRL